MYDELLMKSDLGSRKIDYYLKGNMNSADPTKNGKKRCEASTFKIHVCNICYTHAVCESALQIYRYETSFCAAYNFQNLSIEYYILL